MNRLPHPGDDLARTSYRSSTQLCLHYEDIVFRGYDAIEQAAALQVVCSEAIARVAALEEQLAQAQERSNVVSIHTRRTAPAAHERPGA